MINPYEFYCQQVIPLVYDQSLSYYETLCKISYKLNEVIKSQNDLVNEFSQLKAWIDSQLQLYAEETINEMYDDGRLEALIINSLNLAFNFDTILDMQASNVLRNGLYCKTMGCNTLGDGGASLFKITNVEPTTPYILCGSLYAEVIAQPNMNNLQFGIVGDGVTDVTLPLQNAMNYLSTRGGKLSLTSGRYMIKADDPTSTSTNYLVDSGGLAIPSNFTLDMRNNATLVCIPTNLKAYNIIRIVDKENVTILGGKLEGDRDLHFGTLGGEWGYGLFLSGGNNIVLDGIESYNCWGDGFNFEQLMTKPLETPMYRAVKNVTMRNCYAHNNRRQGISISSGFNLLVSKCRFEDTNGTLPECGIDIEPSNPNAFVTNVIIEQCSLKNNNKYGVSSFSSFANSPIDNVIIRNNVISGNKSDNSQMLFTDGNVNLFLIENFIDSTYAYKDGIIFSGGSKYVVKANTMINAGVTLTNNVSTVGKLIITQNRFISKGTNNNILALNDVATEVEVTRNTFNATSTTARIIIQCSNTLFDGNLLDDVVYGINIYNKDIIVTNNTFNNVFKWCIELNTANASAYISNNTFKKIAKETYSSVLLLIASSNTTVFANNIIIPSSTATQTTFVQGSGAIRCIIKGNVCTNNNFLMTGLNNNANSIFQDGIIGGACNISTKPFLTKTGAMSFNKDANKPIWYDGTKWVFSDGTPST